MKFSDYLPYTQFAQLPYGWEIEHWLYIKSTGLGIAIIKFVARYKDRALAAELHALANRYDTRPGSDPRPYIY